jgi:hypothetical protein
LALIDLLVVSKTPAPAERNIRVPIVIPVSNKADYTLQYLLGFQVIDTQQSDPVRGDYIDPLLGVVRPFLDWNMTRFVAPPDAQTAPLSPSLQGS